MSTINRSNIVSNRTNTGPTSSQEEWTTQNGGVTTTTKVSKYDSGVTTKTSGSRMVTGGTTLTTGNFGNSGTSRVISGGTTATTTVTTTGGGVGLANAIRASGLGGTRVSTTTSTTGNAIGGGQTFTTGGLAGRTTTTTTNNIGASRVVSGGVTGGQTTFTTTNVGASRLVSGGQTTTTTTTNNFQESRTSGIRKSGRRLHGSVVAITEHPEDSYVVSEGRRVGEGRFVSETYHEGTQETVRVEEGKHIIIDNKPSERTIKRADLTGYEEEAIIVEEIEEVDVEVIIEKKIPKITYVDVPYDVIERVPKKRIIEKEIIIKKIKEVPYEKIVEIPVEKIIEVPVETIQEVIVDVPIEKRVAYETVREHFVPRYRDNVIYTDTEEVINVADLARYRNDPSVVRVDKTDVRLHERVVTKEIDDIQVNTIVDVVHEPVYRYEENIVEVPIDAPYTVIDEVATLNATNTNKVVQNVIERRVDAPYDVINETAELRVTGVDKKVTNVIDVQVEEPYTVERINEFAALDSTAQGHEVINTIQNNVYNYRTENRQVRVDVDVPVPLTEVRTQQFEVLAGQPVQQKPEIFVQDVEYHVKKERPVPHNQDITIVVPNVIKREEESVVEVEVPCKVVIEQPVAIEKEVEVEVVNKIEQAVYQEKLTNRPVNFNVVVEREVEVVEEEYYDVAVEKIIEVPVKIIRKNPVEKHEYFETDIHVNTTKTVPVNGSEQTGQTIEIPNQNLQERIEEMNSEINSLTNQTRTLQTQYSTLKIDTSILTRYNDTIRSLAVAQATLNEFESRNDVLVQDIERLQGVSHQFGNGQEITVEYVVPHPDLNRLATELQRLVDENNALVKRVRSAHPQ